MVWRAEINNHRTTILLPQDRIRQRPVTPNLREVLLSYDPLPCLTVLQPVWLVGRLVSHNFLNFHAPIWELVLFTLFYFSFFLMLNIPRKYVSINLNTGPCSTIEKNNRSETSETLTGAGHRSPAYSVKYVWSVWSTKVLFLENLFLHIQDKK